MTPIAPLITNFLREHMPIEQGYSPHTCETYAHAFRLLFIFASKRLGIRPSQICLEQIETDSLLQCGRQQPEGLLVGARSRDQRRLGVVGEAQESLVPGFIHG